MMKAITHYFECGKKAIHESSGDAKITWNIILN